MNSEQTPSGQLSPGSDPNAAQNGNTASANQGSTDGSDSPETDVTTTGNKAAQEGSNSSSGNTENSGNVASSGQKSSSQISNFGSGGDAASPDQDSATINSSPNSNSNNVSKSKSSTSSSSSYQSKSGSGSGSDSHPASNSASTNSADTAGQSSQPANSTSQSQTDSSTDDPLSNSEIIAPLSQMPAVREFLKSSLANQTNIAAFEKDLRTRLSSYLSNYIASQGYGQQQNNSEGMENDLTNESCDNLTTIHTTSVTDLYFMEAIVNRTYHHYQNVKDVIVKECQ